MNTLLRTVLPALFLTTLVPSIGCHAQQAEEPATLDEQVEAFLESNRRSWRDMNIPPEDGQTMYDIIVEQGYTRALEVGTSTGHSSIWLAWALSKTGGKLITVEIDERRYRQALANFEEAGVADFIDARLADAHELVPALEGPFDFVFVDADKDWYPQYFEAILPKLEPGGCYTAHNVSRRRGGGIGVFVEMLDNTPELETEIIRPGRSGLSVSYKKR